MFGWVDEFPHSWKPHAFLHAENVPARELASARFSRDSTARSFVSNYQVIFTVYRAVLQCWHSLRFIYSFVTPCKLE